MTSKDMKDWIATFLVVVGVMLLSTADEAHAYRVIMGVPILTFGIRYTIDRGRADR